MAPSVWQSKQVCLILNPLMIALRTKPINTHDLSFFDQQLSQTSATSESTDDLLAAINGGSSVDRSSYYPPPASPVKMPPMPMDDIDLLTHQADDILGDLGKPVQPRVQHSILNARDDLPPGFSKPRPKPIVSSSDDDSDDDIRRAKAESLLTADVGMNSRHGKAKEVRDPRAPFIRQIVEMGFTPDQAKAALASTDTGLDVNSAIQTLLEIQGNVVDAPQRERPAPQKTEVDWVDQGYAVATKTLSSANRWLTNKSALARRKLAEYNESTTYTSDVHDDRPKWMRDAERFERKEKGKAKAKEDELREEGLPMHPTERKRLEQNGVLPGRRDSVESSKSGKSFASILSMESIGWKDSRKFKNDDDAVVVSRRRRPEKSEEKPAPAPVEEDLFGPRRVKSIDASVDITTSSKGKGRERPRQTRSLPFLDAGLLATSSQHRNRGSEAYKRGDFAKALTYFDSALSSLPESHPVRILSLTNRALVQIQIGAPKLAINDCNDALRIIGSEHGANETIDDANKQIPMTQLWAKAMNRKATALEMQEQNQEALKVWQELVRSGHGTMQDMESRQRCEKLLAPRKATTQAPIQQSGIAVQKLRAETAKQVSSDLEKDKLYESVNSRLDEWSAGKDQNIRSLLSSLPTILSPVILTTWKPVTLADLVTTSKVKITYMKALSKVHPDKISRDATTEDKMISAGVFSTLNKAWDAFKSQNNL